MAERPRTSDNRKSITEIAENYSYKIVDLSEDYAGDDDDPALCRNGGGLIRVEGTPRPVPSDAAYEYDDDIDR